MRWHTARTWQGWKEGETSFADAPELHMKHQGDWPVMSQDCMTVHVSLHGWGARLHGEVPG